MFLQWGPAGLNKARCDVAHSCERVPRRPNPGKDTKFRACRKVPTGNGRPPVPPGQRLYGSTALRLYGDAAYQRVPAAGLRSSLSWSASVAAPSAAASRGLADITTETGCTPRAKMRESNAFWAASR